MATKLAQIVAIHTGVKGDANRVLAEAALHASKSDLLTGLTRVYSPFDADDEREQLPPETKHVQLTASGLITEVERTMTRLLDVTSTKDRTNCDARADIVVDGHTLAQGVPVTYLMWLEKALGELRTFIGRLPVLDPAERWSFDEASGTWVSEPQTTLRTRKVPKSVVKWEPPTPEFKQPAQVDMYTEDVPVGKWTVTKFSGALPAPRRAEMLRRVTALTEAVKQARERANEATAVDTPVGAALLGYVFDGATSGR